MCSWLFKLVGPAELALAKKIDPGLFFDAGAPLLRGTYGWWEIQVTISREFGTIGHWCAVKMEIMGRIRWTVLRHANFLSSHVTKPFHLQVTNWDTRDSPYTEHWRQISCRFRWVICLHKQNSNINPLRWWTLLNFLPGSSEPPKLTNETDSIHGLLETRLNYVILISPVLCRTRILKFDDYGYWTWWEHGFVLRD